MLKPCIWCDNKKVKVAHNHEGYYVKCSKCGYILAGFDTTREVRAEWNNLIHTADLRERKERTC